ncbi:MAG: GWxTD domain-containing protein, partial [candidate division Zixibacteria bacterium]|nr:GWxTD domain-containing protein [candidate division KSB1 bacterium]NIT74703.1 GWxTD domain-containing protein [candidate division KSB1 bacterium]NIV08764.1 GWxTD domain-containing protein [candidate division Zixibacteria bacterium]NIW73017.1 GWxTD domain-containing protein [candidate division KSB1 bacterium]NIX74383.1 GWxTD domain-containing protein [candidate division KSB1 bacterium]
IVGGNNIVALESDTYFFHLKVIDDQIGDSAKSSKRFTLFKPSKEQIARTEQVRANSNKLMLNYYSSFSEEELDEEFAKAEYIATDEEKKIFKDLNKSGKAEFLANFWNKRDANKESPHNEYRIEYFQLVEYASEKFQTKFREGWKTDRGRVLLTYGAPNDIERSPMQQNKKPYEVWSYDKLEGGCIFVFADLQGFGDYDLIHSTYSQEISHPDWQDLVRESSERDQLFDGFRQ